jgi:hypothetical protein
MKKALLCIGILITLSISLKAQISLIGAASNPDSGNIDILRWRVLDSLSVTTIPTILDGYYFGTSSYDATRGNYYIQGTSSNNTGLFSYNSLTGSKNLGASSLYTNIVEFDMSTGKMYNLIMETEGIISIYESDINANQKRLIGVIYEPGANGIVADAIGFDSNNGIIYYVGFNNDPALILYSIPVRESQFSFSKTILNTTDSYNNINSVNFDNVNNILYATNDTYDSQSNFTGRNIIEIDKGTGDIINRVKLIDFSYFVSGSSSFDQNTGTFLLVGIDTNSLQQMIAFNTSSNTYDSGFVPDNVSEIVCDNSIFARQTYMTTGVKEESALDFKLYPNPVSEILNIEHSSSDPVRIIVFSSLGKQVFVQDYVMLNKIDLNLTHLTPGLYTINLITKDQTASKKIFVH